MRILFLGVPLHGHVRPTRAFVAELVRRGHLVRYVAGGAVMEVITHTGADAVSYRTPAVHQLAHIDRLSRLPLTVMEVTAAVLRDDLAPMREWSPDLVITDALAPWGYWVAELLGVPLVTSVPTFAFNARVMIQAILRGSVIRPRGATREKLRAVRAARRIVRELRRTYGVRGVGPSVTAYPRAPLNVVHTARTFQPLGESFPAGTWCFAGPAVDLPRTVEREQRRTFVSMGTLFQHDGMLEQCARGLASESRTVLLSTGGAEIAAAERELPNVQWRPFVDQQDELARSTSFVTHAGLGSVHEALLAGVPMVLLPRMTEQGIVAQRVAALGAGIVLRPGEVTPERIRAAVERVEGEPAVAAAAARLGEALRRGTDAVGACEAIERRVAAT